MMKHLATLTGIDSATTKLVTTKWSTSAPISTSINVKTQQVYNILDGYSLEIRENIVNSKTLYTVSMKICNDLIIRYLNLDDVDIPSRSAIPSRFKIGTTSSVVGIEYCTRARSPYPVRIDRFTYYKQDPTKFLLEDYVPKISMPTFYVVACSHFEVFDSDGGMTYGVY